MATYATKSNLLNSVSATVTRPADTNQYTSGDAISNSTNSQVAVVLTFAGCAVVPGGSGWIISSRLIDEANQSTPGSFELYLFAVSPAATADNAALALSASTAETLVGVIKFIDSGYVTNAGAGASGSVAYVQESQVPFVCAPTDVNLYGLLVVRNAYTPVSGEKFAVALGISSGN